MSGRPSPAPRARDERGFTLVELLVVMIILGTVLAGVVAMFVAGSNAQLAQNRRFQAQVNARTALERIRREAHCATSAAPAGASSSVTLTLPAGCAPDGATTVTWCTRGTAPRFALFRIAGATCTGGDQHADYLTVANVFTYTAGTGAALSRLFVDLPIDVSPTDGRAGYALEENLVLRNDVR